MAQVVTKDNYFAVTTDLKTGVVDFDLLSFQFIEFSKWLSKNPNSYDTYVVTQETAGLLDLISYLYYGSESYWWIIAVANNMLDPVNEVVYGKTIRLPTKNAISSYISSLTSEEIQVIEI